MSERAQQRQPLLQQYDSNELQSLRNRQIAKGIVAGGLPLTTIGLIAVSIIYDNGDAYNGIITTVAGTVLGGAFLLIPYRTKLNGRDITVIGWMIDFTKDKVIKYAAVFFIVATQTYLNVPQPRWAVRFVFGVFNGMLGVQLATKIDNIAHWNLKNDRNFDVDLASTSPSKIKNLMGNGPHTRRSIEVVKIVVAVAAIVLGYYFSSASIAFKLGTILLGHGVGVAFHETVHGLKKHLENKLEPAAASNRFESPEATTPTSLKVLILTEKLPK